MHHFVVFEFLFGAMWSVTTKFPFSAEPAVNSPVHLLNLLPMEPRMSVVENSLVWGQIFLSAQMWSLKKPMSASKNFVTENALIFGAFWWQILH